MANGIIGITCVFTVTAVLFLIQHLFLTLGRSKKYRARATRSQAAKEEARQDVVRDKGDSELSRTESGVSANHWWHMPRFRI